MTQPTPTDSGEERIRLLREALTAADYLHQEHQRKHKVPVYEGEWHKINNALALLATPPQPSADEKQETPETDAKEIDCDQRYETWAGFYGEMRDFARALERRLRAATARAEAAEKQETPEAVSSAGEVADPKWKVPRGDFRPYGLVHPAYVEHLRADLATLKARCEGLEKELAMVLKDWNDIVEASGAPTHGTAIARVAQLREDRERLEWLEANYVQFLGWNPHPDMGGNQWGIRITQDYRAKRIPNCRTARAAIDAARQSAGSGEGKV